MRVALTMHCEQTTGRLDDALRAAGAKSWRFHLERGDGLPEPDSFDRVVVLGGAMGAYDGARFPWLDLEKKWLRELVADRVPILGICLGSQLLADALGGEAFRADRPEAAVIALELTEAGQADPVVSHAGPLVYSLHQDTFSLPPGATLLARTELFPHAFRCGSALALQFHPDADLDQALRWGREDWGVLGAAGVSYDHYAAQLAAADALLDAGSRALFASWLEEE
jgi:GMP synthase (glutamine-hydrolysing)